MLRKLLKNIRNKMQHVFDWICYHDHSMLWLGRTPFSIMGQIWEIHLFDADPFPSIPHMHSIENQNYRLDVYTGDVYYKKILHAKIKEKELRAIWECDKIRNDISRARNYYQEKNENCVLPEIPYIVHMEKDDNIITTYHNNKIQLDKK